MKKFEVTIIDYGMGNIWSVASALKYLDCKVIISADPKMIETAEALILPGVGSFAKAMKSLKQLGLDEAILESALNRKVKLLGICLGMQLMGLESTEDGTTLGLKLIAGRVNNFTQAELGTLKTPHVGFNKVTTKSQSVLFNGIQSGEDFYFVHSYRMLPANLTGLKSTCTYGIEFLAAYEKENLFATQFHPEKSQANGLRLLQNFITS
jgi:glutamine amidotransferase